MEKVLHMLKAGFARLDVTPPLGVFMQGYYSERRAAGSLRVEIQKPDGTPNPGFRLDDCPAIIGDAIEQPVRWSGDVNLERLAGEPVRIRFVMTECDLYSFRFSEK